MKQRKLELTAGLLDSYYDGELDEDRRHQVELALAADQSAAVHLTDCRLASQALAGLRRESEPDELSLARSWQRVAQALEARPERRGALRYTWYSLAAAAAGLLLFFAVQVEQGRAELVVESIDCTYSSFMILKPAATEEGHTIIWINDHQEPAE